MSKDYSVQLCPENVDTVQNMVCMIEPDLIIISQVGMVDEDIAIFQLFKTRYLKIPMLIIALKELQEHFEGILSTDRNVLPVYRPVTKSKILESCKVLLWGDEILDEEDITNPQDVLETQKAKQDSSDSNTRKHILVVDDSQLVLRNVRRLLCDRYFVTLAESGEQALEYMERRKPDLVLLDYEMSGWDGKKTFEVHQKYFYSVCHCDNRIFYLRGIVSSK